MLQLNEQRKTDRMFECLLDREPMGRGEMQASNEQINLAACVENVAENITHNSEEITTFMTIMHKLI